jgi:GNAT superfamily N-acetyltransferase
VTAVTPATAAIAIALLGAADRAEWEALARGYKAFYRDDIPDEDYERTWRLLIAGAAVHGLGARVDGRLVGIAHYLFHPQSWQGEVCYLQDLFTAEDARGRGVATALIDAVADAARARGAARYYWLTKEDNLPGRALYDRIARFKGFLRYDYPL